MLYSHCVFSFSPSFLFFANTIYLFQLSIFSASINRLKLFTGQCLLQRRKLQYCSEYCCHSSVICKRLIVKDQILQCSFFNCLKYKSMCAIYRCNDLYRTAFQHDGFCWTISCAYTTTKADLFVYNRSFLFD